MDWQRRRRGAMARKTMISVDQDWSDFVAVALDDYFDQPCDNASGERSFADDQEPQP